MGVVSALFIKALYGFEDFFENRVGGSYYRQHLLGMFIVGVIIYGMVATTGHYYVEGVGYATVQQILSGGGLSFILLIVLFALKLLATSLTLGSGASGGIFSPALFLGATLGAAYGMALERIFPHMGISAAAFAVAGMAGVVGGATGAAMAAIVMIFEMTLDYDVIVPMTITVAISYGVRKALSRESIYTMKLARRGHYIPESLQTNPSYLRQAKELMTKDFARIPAATTLKEFAQIVFEKESVPAYLVEDRDKIAGFVRREAALGTLKNGESSITMGKIADQNFIAVQERTALFDVLVRMRVKGASIALVTDDPSSVSSSRVKGLIWREQLADAMVEASDLGDN
jgi:CIC family chloride channel protein